MVPLHKYLLKFCFRNSKPLHILRLQYKEENKATPNLDHGDSLLAFQYISFFPYIWRAVASSLLGPWKLGCGFCRLRQSRSSQEAPSGAQPRWWHFSHSPGGLSALGIARYQRSTVPTLLWNAYWSEWAHPMNWMEISTWTSRNCQELTSWLCSIQKAQFSYKPCLL